LWRPNGNCEHQQERYGSHDLQEIKKFSMKIVDESARLPLPARRDVCDEGADGVVDQVPLEASLRTIRC
jgi:hypothetical protein